MVMGQRSDILYITIPAGILLVDPIAGHVIGQLTIPSSSLPSTMMNQEPTNDDKEDEVMTNAHSSKSFSHPTALTLSGDGYLYIAANHNHLYRIRTNDRPVVFLPKKRKATPTTKHGSH